MSNVVYMIDNYDSFTYNLVQYLGELGVQVEVGRNDKITLSDIENTVATHLIISPGPCTPNEAGISMDAIRHFSGKIPVLGVCLGHQAIGQVFGAKVVKAQRIMHGKTSMIDHDGKSIFQDIPSPYEATRYHSLTLQDIPDCLEITARTIACAEEEPEVMGIRHKKFAIEGVQYHPEAILTEYGHKLLQNFINQTKGKE